MYKGQELTDAFPGQDTGSSKASDVGFAEGKLRVPSSTAVHMNLVVAGLVPAIHGVLS